MEISHTPISIIIILVTVVLSLYTIYKNQSLFYKWMLHPPAVIHGRQYHQLLTSGFLHADIMHLLFNMLTFYFFGFQLETYIGSVNFLIIYLVSMLSGNIFTVFKKKNDENYASVGASGAVAGILFSFIMISPFSSIMIFPIPFGIPAWIFGILYLTWTYFAAKKSFDRINHTAHFFGAVAGVILPFVLFPGLVKFLNL